MVFNSIATIKKKVLCFDDFDEQDLKYYSGSCKHQFFYVTLLVLQ